MTYKPLADYEMPPMPEARIESYQIDSTMRSMKLHTYDTGDMHEYGRATESAVLARVSTPLPASDAAKTPPCSTERIWECKIGGVVDDDLPHGADYPMRQAVEAAFKQITGRAAQFNFSGWGGTLTEPERAVVERRMPSSAPLPVPGGWEITTPIEAGLSWSGFNLYGDKKSIDRAKQAIHDSDVWVPCLRAKLEKLRAAAPAAPLPVEPEPVQISVEFSQADMNNILMEIGDMAHNASTGPAVPDVLWQIRGMAYDAIQTAPPIIAPPATSPDTLAAIRQGIEALEDIRRYTAGPIGWWRQVRDVIASLQAAERAITGEQG